MQSEHPIAHFDPQTKRRPFWACTGNEIMLVLDDWEDTGEREIIRVLCDGCVCELWTWSLALERL